MLKRHDWNDKKQWLMVLMERCLVKHSKSVVTRHYNSLCTCDWSPKSLIPCLIPLSAVTTEVWCLNLSQENGSVLARKKIDVLKGQIHDLNCSFDENAGEMYILTFCLWCSDKMSFIVSYIMFILLSMILNSSKIN